MRDKIQTLISSLIPFDTIEKEHIRDAIEWINSGNEIFRIKKPDIPHKHLVSYFVPIDKNKNKVLLIDHRKSGLWLPPGGHVEKNENPQATVVREAKEELNIIARFIFTTPFFITVTNTVNIDAGHTDVSLWYLIHGDKLKKLVYDKREMKGTKWFSFEEILKTEKYTFDPHMKRFIMKVLKSDFL